MQRYTLKHQSRNLVALTFSSMMLLVLMMVACASAEASAGAEGPRWVLSAVTTPTHLISPSPRRQIEQLTVNATGGEFRLLVAGGETNGYVNADPTSWLPYNATAAEVEAAINETLALETGGTSVTVNVTGGPGGSAPYEIEVHAESLRSMKFDQADSSRLTGGQHTAGVVITTKEARTPYLVLKAINVGGPTDGSTVTLTDVLPPGVIATAVKGSDMYRFGASGVASMACAGGTEVHCTYTHNIDTGDILLVKAELAVESGLSEHLANEATVSGGGAPTVEGDKGIVVSETPAPFGLEEGGVLVAVSNRQAGGRPDVTTAFRFTTSESATVSATPKDVRFDLPVGLVGNTVGMPRCTMAKVALKECLASAAVGIANVTILTGAAEVMIAVPVYNIAPAPGEPAAFGFEALTALVRLDTGVLSDGDNRVSVVAHDLSEKEPINESIITIWGVPANHNGPGSNTLTFAGPSFKTFGGKGTGSPVPLLSNPQQCSSPLDAFMLTDPWVEPGVFFGTGALPLETLSGCEQLRFGAKFSMVPDTLEAGAPAGYKFDLEIPQNEAAGGLATPNVKNVSLKLPVGTVVNPSAAWGLKACSNVSFYGPDHPSQKPAQEAKCPRESQVGTVSVKTPALEEALEGQVFLAEPECDPCTPQDAEDGKMVRLFVQAVSEGEGGIVIKLEGHGHIDQKTGQITTIFENDPQLPFSEFKLKLSGGPRAVLANPRSCGSVTSSMDVTPWSTPVTPDSTPSYSFDINQNCFGPSFSPSFVAGSTNIQAGAYTPFTLAFGRSDNDQFLNGLSLSMPPGLLGNIGSVPLCKEPEAANGTCGAASLIGHVQVLTGPGANPFLVSGGQVFLTESYGGAPYGLSIVVPAVAGPYTLAGTTGKGTVVVRAKIVVDPIDAHLTVTSDPLPTVLDGIPLQLKAVNVTIDKPNFTFNSTSCAKTAIGGTLTSSEGMSSVISRSFQVTNCASLGFKPQFKVSTSGKTSRAQGASLNVKLAYPKAPFGSQANVAKVKVDLPKQLPSRLSTLQKACTAKTFETNPAACPAASRVGMASATTPIIPVALSGPAYFVSYGGAKFPKLVIVLSGYGVTVDLHGETFINEHTNITSSTFRQVPDVPIGAFELTLPQGPNSALAAIANLCTTTLKMPTAFTAQNGMQIKQSTPITTTGCPKHKATKKNNKHKKK